MLFFPSGGKLKIHFRRTGKQLPEPLAALFRLPYAPARKNSGGAAPEKRSCSIDNSDTHAICPFQ